MNNPSEVVEDMLKGFISARRMRCATKKPESTEVPLDANRWQDGVVTRGGSGDKPAFMSYVKGACSMHCAMVAVSSQLSSVIL